MDVALFLWCRVSPDIASSTRKIELLDTNIARERWWEGIVRWGEHDGARVSSLKGAFLGRGVLKVDIQMTRNRRKGGKVNFGEGLRRP